MSITIRSLDDADRERLMELHGYNSETYIEITTDQLPLPTPAQLERFMRTNPISCSWVRAGIILVCVKLGHNNPTVLSLQDIKRAMRQIWINSSLHRGP